jgi:anti-sigma factor RsiW
MNELPQNELLSAYLDGELTADERARAERLLATDPAARRLLDELRAVSSRLQALPKETVGEDISERVLRLAERRILGEAAGPEGTIGSAAESLVSPWRAVAKRFLNRRILAWSGATIAVAVYLMFNNPEGRQERRQIAKAPAERSSEPPSIRAVVDKESPTTGAESKPAAALPVEKPSPDRATPPRLDVKEGLSKGLSNNVAPSPPAVQNSPEQPRAAAPQAAAPSPAASFGAAPRPGNQPGRAAMQSKTPAKDADGRTQEPEDEVLVVRCEVRNANAPRGPFQKILASQQIDWSDAPLESSAAESESPKAAATPAAKAEERVDEKAGNVETVLVEAGWNQIEGAVAELSKRSDVFLSVSLEPKPGAATPGPLEQYSRRAGQPAQNVNLLPYGAESKQAPLGKLDAEKAKDAAGATQQRGIARPVQTQGTQFLRQRVVQKEPRAGAPRQIAVPADQQTYRVLFEFKKVEP